MSDIRSVLIGCGAALPERVVRNSDFPAELNTSDEWIVERTGIKSRHIAAEGECTSHLGTRAAVEALAHAGIEASSLDLLILATSTPDRTFPATATQIQGALKVGGFPAFDIQAVCSGFVYALSIADNMIRGGAASRAMVIGAETFSRIVDWKDRGTCVLFGDGAGAVILEARRSQDTTRGILGTKISADGALADILYVDGGPSSTQTTGFVRMDGQEVFRHAVSKMASIAGDVLEAAGVEAAAVNWLIPHQANINIINGVARRAGIPSERVIKTVTEHGNTSAASIPLALVAGVRDGRIKQDDLVLMGAIGGGLSWGAALLRM